MTKKSNSHYVLKFDSRKKGDSDQVRAQLEQDLENMKYILKQLNEAKKLNREHAAKETGSFCTIS